MREKRKYVTTEQKELLLAMIEKNPKMITTNFSDSFTKQDMLKLWDDAAVMLNSCEGTQKTAREWKKVSTQCRILNQICYLCWYIKKLAIS